MSGPFKMKNAALSASAKYKSPIPYASPMKAGETSLVDKIKSGARAVFSNLGKVNTNSSTLSDKISDSYKENKKEYRDEATKNSENSKGDRSKGYTGI